MPVGAHGLTRRLSRDALTTQDVLAVGNRLQVRGVYAGSVAAEVIEGQAVWDRPNKKFVGKPMSQLHAGPCL